MYEATTAATVVLSDDRVSGDTLDEAYGSALFADKNVGNGTAVSVSGITVSGIDAEVREINEGEEIGPTR